MKSKKRLVALTGAGMSAESGLKTFRDMGGLWEEYDVTQVASPDAWASQPELVLRFYNERRKALLEAEPNKGHRLLVDLENDFDVRIVTQNVDDLHERAGSSYVLHLHGELRKARSTTDDSLVYDLEGWELKWGDTCEKGSQLRPHVVWFGESVPNIMHAVREVEEADIIVVIGTSLNVYPAAGLLYYASGNIPLYLIDPNPSESIDQNVKVIQDTASNGMAYLIKELAIHR